MKNSSDGVGAGGVDDPFVCKSTMVTRATAELNEEIINELQEEDRSIASITSIADALLNIGGGGLGKDESDESDESDGGADADA